MLAKPTSLGYLRFSFKRCNRTFNERTGTPFNFLGSANGHYVSGRFVARAVQIKPARFGRDVFAARFSFTCETVCDWEVRFGPLLAEHLRRKRHQHAGRAGMWMKRI